MAGGDLGCEALSCEAQPWSYRSWRLPAPTHTPALAIAPPHPCSHLDLHASSPFSSLGGLRSLTGKSPEVRNFLHPLPLPPLHQYTQDQGPAESRCLTTQAFLLQAAHWGTEGPIQFNQHLLSTCCMPGRCVS